MARTEPAPKVLYAEDGWSWAWVFSAPLFCLFAAVFELVSGAPVHWWMLTVCAVASAMCHGVMIAATRVHGRVRVTEASYTQGTEELELERIAAVRPLPGDDVPEASWESARTVGELREVPRRRKSVGLLLDNGGEVRAWARDSAALHAALVTAVGERPAVDPKTEPAVEPATEPTVELATGPATEPEIEPATGPAGEPASDPDSAREPSSDFAPDSNPDAAREATPGAARESAPGAETEIDPS